MSNDNLHGLPNFVRSVNQIVKTTEKGLRIDLPLMHEAYERCDVNHIVWISGDSNPADDLTKVERRCGALAAVLTTNMFKPAPSSWFICDESLVRTECQTTSMCY